MHCTFIFSFFLFRVFIINDDLKSFHHLTLTLLSNPRDGAKKKSLEKVANFFLLPFFNQGDGRRRRRREFFSLDSYISSESKWATFFYRRLNVSRLGDPSRCWNSPSVQKTYILFLSPSSEDVKSPFYYFHHKNDKTFEARYDEAFGAVIDFNVQEERKLLDTLGE